MTEQERIAIEKLKDKHDPALGELVRYLAPRFNRLFRKLTTDEQKVEAFTEEAVFLIISSLGRLP